MAAISETLRQARLRSGIDLDRLAEKTKIHPRYLQAIEAGDFAKLPSGIFARMFVKQYADAVGLDGALVAEEFRRTMSFGYEAPSEFQTLTSARRDYHPVVPGISAIADRDRKDRLASMLSSFIWAVGAILACSGAYYGLAHLASRSASPSGKPTAVVPVTTPGVTPAPVAHASPATPAGTPPAASAKAPAAPIELSISASDPVWVTAIADGKNVLSETVPAGATRTISATDSARLTLGNAGGVEITFNGKKLDPIGERGQVRSVTFTPQGPQLVSRASPKGDPPASPGPSANPDPLR